MLTGDESLRDEIHKEMAAGRQAALDTAYRAIDALGGAGSLEDPRYIAFCAALDEVLQDIGRRGGMDPAVRRQRQPCSR